MEQQQTEQQQEKCPAGIHLDILSDGGNIKNQSQITPLNIGLGAFSGSGTSQLGLSFVSQQVFPSKGDHEKHHHTSLFEDDSDGLLEGFESDIDAICDALIEEEPSTQVQKQVEGSTDKPKQVEEDLEIPTAVTENQTMAPHEENSEDIHEESTDICPQSPVESLVDSSARRVRFKKDLVEVRFFHPDDVSTLPATNVKGSPDTSHVSIKPILKRRRDKKKENAQPSDARPHLMQDQMSPSEEQVPLVNRTPELRSQRVPTTIHAINGQINSNLSELSPEGLLLKSVLDLECSVQMLKDRGDILYARVQRAVHRLHTI